GKRIVVTRASEQASEFSRLLEAYGAEPIEAPTIQIRPPVSWQAIDRAIVNLAEYSWLIFTSVNGVKPFMRRLREACKDGRALAHLQICTIGPRTADEVGAHGLIPDVVPSEYQAEGVLAALAGYDLRGKKVLIPRAEVAREVLPDQLRMRGAKVDVVPVYRTVAPAEDLSGLRSQLEAARIDVLTFTSSSTVRNFVELSGGAEAARRLALRTCVACIGPITAQTAEECGLPVTIMASENTVPALAEAIVRYFSANAKMEVSAS
ncbi:uroporphyrinogen-III synthase, partial [Petrachloros mirabilis]